MNLDNIYTKPVIFKNKLGYIRKPLKRLKPTTLVAVVTISNRRAEHLEMLLSALPK